MRSQILMKVSLNLKTFENHIVSHQSRHAFPTVPKGLDFRANPRRFFFLSGLRRVVALSYLCQKHWFLTRQFIYTASAPCSCYATLSGRILRISFSIACAVSHRSIARCAFNQNSGEFPKSLASRRAISGLTALRSRSSSLIDCRETPTDSAKLETVNS